MRTAESAQGRRPQRPWQSVAQWSQALGEEAWPDVAGAAWSWRYAALSKNADEQAAIVFDALDLIACRRK